MIHNGNGHRLSWNDVIYDFLLRSYKIKIVYVGQVLKYFMVSQKFLMSKQLRY